MDTGDLTLGQFSPDLSEWLLLAAVSFTVSVALIGLAIQLVTVHNMGSRTWRSKWTLYIVGGLVGTAMIPLLTISVSPFGVIRLSAGELAESLIAVARLYLLPLFLGALLAGLLIGSLLLVGRWLPSRRVVIYRGVAFIVAFAFIMLILVGSAASRLNSRHPAGLSLTYIAETETLAEVAFPLKLAVAPDGRVFYTLLGQPQIAVLEPSDNNGSYEKQTYVQTELPGGNFWGIALDPRFPEQPYVYATASYVENGVPYMKVLRFREQEGRGFEETLVADRLPGMGSFQHVGGAIGIGPDGYLYVTTSDMGADIEDVQNLLSLKGKVLRYDLAEDAPTIGVVQGSPIFALGFRNPFGLTFDPVTRNLVLIDNGVFGLDQIRVVEPGTNHEWPLSGKRKRITPPLFDSRKVSIAPTGLDFYTTTTLAKEFFNNLFVSTWKSASIYRFVLNEDHKEIQRADVILEAQAGITDVVAGPDGYLYFTQPNSIQRIKALVRK